VDDAVAVADDGGGVCLPGGVGVAVTVVVTVTVGVLGPAAVGSEEQAAVSSAASIAVEVRRRGRRFT